LPVAPRSGDQSERTVEMLQTFLARATQIDNKNLISCLRRARTKHSQHLRVSADHSEAAQCGRPRSVDGRQASRVLEIQSVTNSRTGRGRPALAPTVLLAASASERLIAPAPGVPKSRRQCECLGFRNVDFYRLYKAVAVMSDGMQNTLSFLCSSCAPQAPIPRPGGRSPADPCVRTTGGML
jgi:hypothetical protein